MNKKNLILAIIFVLSGILYYQFLVNPTGTNQVLVARVIDGDTFEIENGAKVRLKGINTPEKSEPFYDEAKEFVISRIENKSIEIDSSGTDKYGRILAQADINKKLLENGLAYLYYYESDKYYSELKAAEKSARESELGLWKKSPDSNCIGLVSLKYDEGKERCTNNEQLILRNSCSKDLNIIIKDDATHIYKETARANSILTKNFSCIWNNDGDTVYVRDEKGLLIFHRYN